MPTYEYECSKGHRFEVLQKMSDEPVAACTECGSEARRVISGGAGFLFKGDGFYITDYRSDDYKKKASADNGGASAASSDGSSSGEAKGDSTAGGGAEASKPSAGSDAKGTSPKSDS